MDPRIAVRALVAICLLPSLMVSGARVPRLLQDEALQRGLNALKENRLEQALEALTIAERENPEDARIRNFRGITLTQLGKTADAESEYREAIRLDGKFEDAWRNLGFLLWTEHRQGDARTALVQAIELSPADSFAHYYLGLLDMETQQYGEAFHELEESQVPWPEDTAFLIEAARGCVALGKKEQASKILGQLTTRALGVLECAQVASLLSALGEYETAIRLLNSVGNGASPDAKTWLRFDLAIIHLLSGHYAQAAELSRRYVAQSGTAASANELAAGWSLLGIAEARAGNSEQAVPALGKAAKLEPANEEHWLNLTRELMEVSRYREAIDATREGLAAKPDSYALHLRLGAAELSAGQYKEAEAAFRELAEAGDPLETSYLGLAQALLREGRAEEAAVVVTNGEQKIGETFLLSYFRGLSLDRAGKRSEAIMAFREAIRINPRSSEAHLGLGKTELATGQTNEAIAELQEALRLGPGNAQARRLLSQAYRRIGDAKKAEEFADASSEKPATPEGDLLQDFLLPNWQMPKSP